MIYAGVQIRIHYFSMALCFICFGYCINGQAQGNTFFGPKHVHKAGEFSNTIREIKISYNEKVPFETGMIAEMELCSWTLTKNDSLIKEGQGCDPLQNYIFNSPGNYELVFDMPRAYTESMGGACFHPTLPGKYIIEVSPYKLTFDANTVALSGSIQSGVETSGIQLSVNVLFESYDSSTIIYDQPLRSTGVETTVAGSLTGPVELVPGINTLLFRLGGKVTNSNTFIGFDFFNTATQSLWSYALSNPIF